MFLALLFIYYFIKKGIEFQKVYKFKSIANISISKYRQHDSDNDRIHEHSNFTLSGHYIIKL